MFKSKAAEILRKTGGWASMDIGYSSLLKKNHPFLNVRTKYLLCRQGPCSSELRNSYLTALARLDISTYSCWLKSGYTHLSQKRAHIASLTANEGDVSSKPFVLLNQIQVISYIGLEIWNVSLQIILIWTFIRVLCIRTRPRVNCADVCNSHATTV